MYFKLIFEELLIYLVPMCHGFRVGYKYSWGNDIHIFTKVSELGFPLNAKVMHSTQAYKTSTMQTEE